VEKRSVREDSEERLSQKEFKGAFLEAETTE